MHLVIDQLFCDTLDFELTPKGKGYARLARPHRTVWERAVALCEAAGLELVDTEHIEITSEPQARRIAVKLRSAKWVREQMGE